MIESGTIAVWENELGPEYPRRIAIRLPDPVHEQWSWGIQGVCYGSDEDILSKPGLHLISPASLEQFLVAREDTDGTDGV